MSEAAPEATPAAPAGGPVPGTAGNDTIPASTDPTPVTPAHGSEPTPAPAVWDDPAAARAEIEKLRKQNGDERINAKQAAAEEARQEILQKLGLVKGDEKPDADALAKEIATARQEAADRARELAIYKAASAHGADPARLLDSNSFMTSVKGLDPTDGDAVANAIKAAVTANQSLKAARAAGASGVELSGGTGEQGQITEQQLKTMTPEQIVQAQAKGLLRNLLG